MLELKLIPLLPLIGSALVYFLTNKSKKMHALSGWIATASAFSSFLLTLIVFNQLNATGETVTASFWRWFSVGSLQVDFGLSFDKLAAVMTLVVTGVGSLIHLYAIGYMAEDEHRPRFFSYLNLFLFSMLLLVLGDNLLLMFVGWEGVGLCSYLLIGFWFSEMENAKAGQKAFVVNRIGDAGFILGIFTLFAATEAISFAQLEILVPNVDIFVIATACILLFIGACGKSAQIPLYIWLPDAMAGPTPVSALIHAATMVTAGIYMIARLGFMFAMVPGILTIVLVIGTLTALVAATIALVQNDIKKVLAYSTVSQLGYMFMAMGVAAFSNGIFHVVTHAFFKACLFMAAGSVIIGCHHEQDMREYGGLWKKMKFTSLAYFCATLAIAGLPFTSGFFSKDGILWTVFSATGPVADTMVGPWQLNHVCWAIGLLTAFLTAFYMTRSFMMTFTGSYRGHAHPHESPWVVWVPLLILAVPSLIFGLFFGDQLIHYLDAWTRVDMKGGHHHLAETFPMYTTLEHISMGVAIAGVTIGVLFYSVLSSVPAKLAKVLPAIHRFLEDKWRVDELYGSIVVGPLRGLAGFFFKSIDRNLIDTSVNGVGTFVQANGEVARLAHTGRLNLYALFMFVGFIVLTVFWMIL